MFRISLPESVDKPDFTLANVLMGLKVQARVVYALILRDAQTRYGRHQLGFLWLFIEPLFFVIMFILFKIYVREKDTGGMNSAYFMTSGLVPFLLFRQLMQTMGKCIDGSRQLLAFPQVTTFDVLLATILLEFASTLFVFATLVVGISLLDVTPNIEDPLLLLVGISLLGLTGAGAGLIFGSLSPLYPSLKTITNPLLGRPLFITSGIFFSAEMLPDGIRDYALYNPLLHMVEITRSAFFIEFESRYVDWHYACLFAFGLFLVGLLCHQVFRNEVMKRG